MQSIFTAEGIQTLLVTFFSQFRSMHPRLIYRPAAAAQEPAHEASLGNPPPLASLHSRAERKVSGAMTGQRPTCNYQAAAQISLCSPFLFALFVVFLMIEDGGRALFGPSVRIAVSNKQRWGGSLAPCSLIPGAAQPPLRCTRAFDLQTLCSRPPPRWTKVLNWPIVCFADRAGCY